MPAFQTLGTHAGEPPALRVLRHLLFIAIPHHAELATSANPRLYQFEFNVNGKSVVYELLAATPLNPLIPDIASGFRCPGEL